jgi:nucleotide-binding universal stress UspA family protein
MATTNRETDDRVDRLDVRPLVDGDVDALGVLCDRQSSESLRRQFFDPTPPTRARLDRLATQDDGHRVALAALAGDTLVGAAGYGCALGDDGAEAWLFVDEAVADPQVGLRLLTELAAIARAAGIRVLRVDLHPRDRALLEMLDTAPLHTERHIHSGVVTVAAHLDGPSVTARPGPAPGNAAALPFRSVLVPVDCSPFAERAVAVGDWLAHRLGAELHVASAVADDPWWDDRYLTRLSTTYHHATAHSWADGDVAGRVARLATELGPTVLCAATHGRSRSASVAGSTFLAIARATRAPLVAVGQEARAPRERDLPVVACVDGSPASESALGDAAVWARHLGLDITLLTVADAGAGPDAARVRLGGPDEDAEAYLDRLATRPELSGLRVTTEVLSDRVAPHHAIADRLARRPATLVALASRSRTGLHRMAVGSEAARIVRASPVPVLLHRVGADDA